MPALFGRSLVTKVFGIKRRSRALRHALETRVIDSARAAEQAASAADAAHHEGARAAYLQALSNMSGAATVTVPPAPTERSLVSAWERGFQAATKHAQRLIDEMV